MKQKRTFKNKKGDQEEVEFTAELFKISAKEKSEIFIKFLWSMIQPHFFTEKKVKDSEKINSEESDLEDNNFYLVE